MWYVRSCAHILNEFMIKRIHGGNNNNKLFAYFFMVHLGFPIIFVYKCGYYYMVHAIAIREMVFVIVTVVQVIQLKIGLLVHISTDKTIYNNQFTIVILKNH